MEKWGFEVNEIPQIDPNKPVTVRYKALKDGTWQKELNRQVQIPQKDLLGLTGTEKTAVIVAAIEQDMAKIIDPVTVELKSLSNLVGLKRDLGDKSPLPDPDKPILPVEEDIL